jgi:DNA-binding NarL/FixJ family response regulator
MTRTHGELKTPLEAAPGMRIRVLIADTRMFAESLAWLLSEQPDLEIVGVVSTADAAVTLARRLRPNVVVLDGGLPDADGASTAAAIRAANSQTEVVMLSGLGDERLVVGAVEAGCAAFLTKDKTSSELVAAIRAVASGEAYIEPAMIAGLFRRMDGSSRGVGADLTLREHEVLDLVAKALSNQVIADRLVLSVHTVRNHVQNILMKLGAHSRLEAVTIATREALV